MKPGPIFRFICISLAMSILSSCDDIIEPSISKSTVQLEAPANQYQSSAYAVNFWWDAVNHALNYHLQVVTQSFASPGGLILDTIVNNYKFAITLNPGIYQWRVSAANGSSSTPYSTPRGFTILSGSLAQESVLLIAPTNLFVTNQTPVTFQWQSLFGATSYQFELDTNNFVNESAIVSNQVITGQQLNFTFPKDQVYQWRVKAQNDTAQSQWSSISQITYKHTPPGQVTLTSPASGTTVPLPVSLQWNAVTGAAKYKLYVYQSDGVTIYNSSFPMLLTSTSYSFNLGNSGDKINWMVTAVDAVGNESQASTINYFTLQ